VEERVNFFCLPFPGKQARRLNFPSRLKAGAKIRRLE